MSQASTTVDLSPEVEDFQADVLAGLRSTPKELPSKYLYDAEGSRLFEKICELDEYYPTRTEMGILDRHVGEMASALGPRAVVVEFGTGAGLKTEVLLDALEDPVAFVPIDISAEALDESANRLARRFPELKVLPVCADYTQDWEIPEIEQPHGRRSVFFPGSTIGNFDRGPAQDFMGRIAKFCGPGGGFLVGVDLKKDPAVLERAYDDREGVTAAFNLNLLTRMNRELGADFDLQGFRHRAAWNDLDGRVEMHLDSLRDQTVRFEGGDTVSFAQGESICTEHCNKFELDEFRKISERAGFRVENVWLDEKRYFSLQWLVAV